MQPGHTGPWYLTDPHSAIGKAAQRALREVFGAEVALVRVGGAVSIVAGFRDILRAETLLIGLGLPDCRMHSPNENFPIENLEAGVQLNQVLLRELASDENSNPKCNPYSTGNRRQWSLPFVLKRKLPD